MNELTDLQLRTRIAQLEDRRDHLATEIRKLEEKRDRKYSISNIQRVRGVR